MVLGAAAEEYAAVALPADRLGAGEAHDVGVRRPPSFFMSRQKSRIGPWRTILNGRGSMMPSTSYFAGRVSGWRNRN